MTYKKLFSWHTYLNLIEYKHDEERFTLCWVSGDEFHSAVKVWGKPDFFHRVFDDRVIFGGEVGDDDIIIFANGADKRYKKFTFNDSAVF